jgi:acetate kinase
LSSILVVNAGSTSLKLSTVDAGERSRKLGALDEAPDDVVAVGHRVVHGGARFRDPVVIDADVHEQIRALEALAPLHNAPALRGIDEAGRALPDVPQVAVFDTAFHATVPDAAAAYALPARWREEWGVRRFGFHGLSVESCAGRVAVPRLVVCHLGGGCSVTAVLDGRSVDTTMGFTPMEGVPMATRSGSVDPGALLYALRERGLSVDELDRELNLASGLLALGGSADMRELDPDGLAVAVFVHRLAAAVAAMAAALGGLDALVFTAGIGEGSALVRARTCGRLGFLGVELDPGANAVAEPDCEVGAPGSPVTVHVLRAREEVVAARAARRLLSSRPS